jgi:hypothetical protein
MLGTNDFPRVHTELSDSADAEVEHWTHLGSPLKALTAKVLWAIRLHDVVNSYLNQPASRTAIEQGMRYTYSSCTLGGIAAQPRSFLMHIGETRTFAATLYDLNGHTLDGQRLTQWFITGTSVTELPADFSGTATVRADTFGTEGIGVRAGPYTDYVGLTVTPR